MIRECCVCGQLHCDDKMADTQTVRTKRKTTLYFSKKCFYEEVRKNEKLHSKIK